MNKINYEDIVIFNNELGKVVCGYPNKEFKFWSLSKKKLRSQYSSSKLPTIKAKDCKEPTEEQKDKYISEGCPWGEVKKIHKISNIQIIEYLSKGFSNEESNNKIGFSIYLDYKSTSTGASNLDSAILSALAIKYGDSNSSYYASKVLGMNKILLHKKTEVRNG